MPEDLQPRLNRRGPHRGLPKEHPPSREKGIPTRAVKRVSESNGKLYYEIRYEYPNGSQCMSLCSYDRGDCETHLVLHLEEFHDLEVTGSWDRATV